MMKGRMFSNERLCLIFATLKSLSVLTIPAY